MATRRHPAEVTADRLKDEYERYYEYLGDNERTAFGEVIQALEEIPAAEAKATL